MQAIIGGQLVNYLDIHPEGSTTLVIIHGWGHNAELWRVWAEQLPDSIRVLIPDLPLFGKTPALPGDPGLKEYAQFVAYFLTKLKINHVTIMGHSVGGQIAVQLALMEPLLVKQLFLVAPAIVREGSPFIQLGKKTLSLLAKIKWWLPKKWHYALSSSTDWSLATKKQKRVMMKFLKTDLMQYVPQITCFTLLIWAEKDKEILGTGIQVMRQFPKGRLKMVYGAGHNLHLERPEALVQIVQRYLE